MSLIDMAKDALKEIPMADVLRERLSLALDQSADAQRRITELETHLATANALTELDRQNHKKTQQELQDLREKWTEEVRIYRSIEFRRGKRTAGKWEAFCPKCHLPVANIDGYLDVICSDGACKWHVRLNDVPLSRVVSELEMT